MSEMKSHVTTHGHLSTFKNRIVGEHGEAVVLRGMSLFWSQWMPQFYNESTVAWLSKDWNCNAVRAALAVNYGGYAQSPESEWNKVVTVINAAVDRGIYVVVDWHVHEKEQPAAELFFARLARTFPDCPNLIFELWNEPFPNYDWRNDIKPYHEKLISLVRAYSPRNLIILGTPNYCLRPDVAALDPVNAENVAYALHFYAASHKQTLRDRCTFALARGLPILVSEYGTCESNGDGHFDEDETRIWWEFLATHQIGHFNWSIADKCETAAALVPGTSPLGHWPENMLTPSGRLVRSYLRSL